MITCSIVAVGSAFTTFCTTFVAAAVGNPNIVRDDTAESIVSLLATPMTHEGILKSLFDKYGLTLTFGQFGLVGATLRAYLTYLMDAGRVTFEITDNYLCYKAV